jgi:phosphate transport system permease protein
VTACSVGGIGPAIQGTLVLVGIGSLVSVPVGLLAGVYLSEYGRGRRLGTAASFFADVMTGFPSILLGLFVFVLFLRLDPNFTFSAVSGGLALSLLMVPIVARTAEEALRAVPNDVREAALALGFPKHRTTLRVVLGSARVGLVTGILLAVARAGGETAALIMTAFNSTTWFTRLGQPVAALPLYIYDYGLFDYPNWQEDAWGAALVLLLIMLTISLAARLVLGRRAAREGA